MVVSAHSRFTQFPDHRLCIGVIHLHPYLVIHSSTLFSLHSYHIRDLKKTINIHGYRAFSKIFIHPPEVLSRERNIPNPLRPSRLC